jgi:molecular chaperone HscB
MEMMDINEALMELEFEPNTAKLVELKNQISAIETELNNELKKLTVNFETATEEQQKQALTAIKDNYYRSKYLHRIRESLQKMA